MKLSTQEEYGLRLLLQLAREGVAASLTIGELSGFIFMFTLLVFPLRLIGYALSELPHSGAGYRRVKGTIDDPLERDPADTIGRALKFVPKQNLLPCTNCGLAPMDREIAIAKLQALGAGAALARQRFA